MSIELGDMNDQELFTIAVCWTALSKLDQYAFNRVVEYLAERQIGRLRGSVSTINQMIEKARQILAECERKVP